MVVIATREQASRADPVAHGKGVSSASGLLPMPNHCVVGVHGASRNDIMNRMEGIK
jgi:hypothetical protein